ncbi:hypothetical protein B738_23023 [Photorhabdus temperata subsp. temperata M1021]|nr:hypothetical protein B738_23023 [Photorhabdus temperata subsp. temperata M1021]
MPEILKPMNINLSEWMLPQHYLIYPKRKLQHKKLTHPIKNIIYLSLSKKHALIRKKMQLKIEQLTLCYLIFIDIAEQKNE